MTFLISHFAFDNHYCCCRRVTGRLHGGPHHHHQQQRGSAVRLTSSAAGLPRPDIEPVLTLCGLRFFSPLLSPLLRSQPLSPVPPSLSQTGRLHFEGPGLCGRRPPRQSLGTGRQEALDGVRVTCISFFRPCGTITLVNHVTALPTWWTCMTCLGGVGVGVCVAGWPGSWPGEDATSWH